MLNLLKSSIRTQLLALVIFAVLPALAIIIYTGIEQRQEKMQDIHVATYSLMQSIASRQQVVMESSRQFLHTLSRMPEVQRLDRQACNILFKALIKENPLYANIFVVNKDGRVVAATVPLRSWNVSHRKYFRDAVTTRSFSTGEYLIAVMTQSPVFTLSYPILDGAGEVKGVVALALDLKKYDRIMTEAKVPGSILSLTDHKGIRLYRYPDGNRYRGLPDLPEMMQHMSGASDEGTFVASGVDGVKRLYAYKNFRLSKGAAPYLYMRLGIPEERALAEAWSITRRNLIILGIVAVFALVSAWLLGGYLIGHPIERLTLLTTRFRNGERDLGIDTPVANNEVGLLSESFREMITEIRTREDAQKKALEEIRQQADLLNLTNDAIFVQDADHRITFWNRGAERRYGWSAPEALGKVSFELLKTHFPEPLNEMVREMSLYRYWEGELIHTSKFGNKLTVASRWSAQLSDNGQLLSILEINSDITARKKAENDLRIYADEISDLYNNAPCGYHSLDTQAMFIRINDTELKWLGYSREELLGKKRFPDLMTPESQASFSQNYPRFRMKGSISNVEYDLVRKDGSIMPVFLNATAIADPEGRFLLSRASMFDSTERKKAEQERRDLQDRLSRSEKMEALGLMAGGVAHDLNNALGLLVGYAEFLHDDFDDSDPRKEDARNILMGGEQAAAVVQDLLTLARRGVQTKTTVNLNKIVREYLKSPEYMKLTTLHPGIRIRTELEGGLLLIRGSSVHLSKTLTNLVINAAEAMPSGGDLLIRTENRYLDRPVSGYDELRDGDYVVLTVRDEGEGISAGDMQHIFEPFYTKKVMGRSGTGLGLSVVWGTVKDHSGYIDVESRMGEGSTFQLYFPVTEEGESEKDAAISVDHYTGHGERILVIDDVLEQRNLARRILTGLQYEVETAGSGEEGVSCLRERPFDLIVLDMIMDPGIDGFETYRRILEVRPGQRAIIVSGFAETERVKMAQALGAGPFVRKPYIKERIGMAVKNELERV